MDTTIREIAQQFQVGQVTAVAEFGNGLINETFLVTTAKKERFVLQKMHRILKPSVLEDIDAVTSYLSQAGFTTTRLVKTRNGQKGILGEEAWRMLTFIPGMCHERGVTPNLAYRTAALVGRFHYALSHFDYKFKHVVPEFHRLDKKIARLEATLKKFQGTQKYVVLLPLAEKIILASQNVRKLDHLPDRIIHGDLKINNIRFDSSGELPISLLDLDSLGRNKVAIDIGDAVKSWCNFAQEGDITNAALDFTVFEQIIKGYVDYAPFLTPEEIESLPDGVEIIFIELTARYLTDAFEESYFRHIKTHYKDLYEQNLVKAQIQLKLLQQFQEHRQEINTFVKSCARERKEQEEQKILL